MSKRVFITGGTKGIGLATANLFLEKEFDIVVAGRSADAWALAKHPRVKSIVYDFSDLSGLANLAAQVGDIDILINNAGIMYGVPYTEYTEEMKKNIMTINLEAQIELIKIFAPLMAKKGWGRIVNNASIAGQIGHPDIWYGISKAGVINITKSFAKIFGSRGVVINAVAAGPVETDMLSTIPVERQEAIKKGVITGRFAKPEEMAATFYWLATDCPEYINGTCIDLNNGFFPR